MSQVSSLIKIGGAGGVVGTLTGDSGGPVSPSLGGNINIVGGTNVSVVGTPLTNTLTINVNTNIELAYTNVNATPYVVTASDEYLSVDTSALAITIQLPNAPTTKRIFIIKDRSGNSAAKNITVTTVGGIVLIDGLVSRTINAAYQSMQLLFNGSAYEIF